MPTGTGEQLPSKQSAIGTGWVIFIVILVFLIFVVIVDVSCCFVSKCGVTMCIWSRVCGRKDSSKEKAMEAGERCASAFLFCV